MCSMNEVLVGGPRLPWATRGTPGDAFIVHLLHRSYIRVSPQSRIDNEMNAKIKKLVFICMHLD